MNKKGTKRFVALATTIALLSSASVMNASASASAFLVGDLNGDGEITISDAYASLQTYAEQSAGFDVQINLDIYDVNSDGVLSVMDSYLTLIYYAEKSAGKEDCVWPPANEAENEDAEDTKDAAEFKVGMMLQFVGDSWNIRKTPDLTADNVIDWLDPQDTFLILEKVEQEENWFVIRTTDTATVGYVNLERADLFKIIEKQEGSTTTEATTTTASTTTTNTTSTTTTTTTTTVTATETSAKFKIGNVLKFTGTSWNIRSSQSLNSDDNIVGKLQNGDQFVIIAEAGDDWYILHTVEGNIVGYVNLEQYWYFEQQF